MIENTFAVAASKMMVVRKRIAANATWPRWNTRYAHSAVTAVLDALSIQYRCLFRFMRVAVQPFVCPQSVYPQKAENANRLVF